ncbi:MAG: IS5 family transposase [Oscillospiraceae bacterium]|nr:IS5 family transposase [Oscillospiraceae bacterium]
MYRYSNGQISLSDFKQPVGMNLKESNRWVKKAQTIPWPEIEKRYAALFTNRKGNVAKPLRLALGACIIQAEYGYSDEETALQIQENPYLQYFCGYDGYDDEKMPFDSSLMVYFRKRLTPAVLGEINEMIIRDAKERQEKDNTQNDHDESDHNGTNNDSGSDVPDTNDGSDNDSENSDNSGTMIIDATCAPSNIRYPQDVSLLNEARENAEKLLDTLHDPADGRKPRTYRRCARKDYLKYTRSRKHTAKTTRKAIGKQLSYLRRDLEAIDGKLSLGKTLTVRQTERLNTIRTIYAQQKYMHDNHTHSVPDRIVSVSQPFVRPIVRGKAGKPVEFGAKLDISVADGWTRLECYSFDAYNEAGNLKAMAERFREREGHYPARILADKIYRNRENLSYCRERGIRLSGPALGRPRKDETRNKVQDYKDECERVEVERKFSLAKRKCGMGLVTAKLQETAAHVFAMSILLLNLRRIQYAFLRLFAHLMTLFVAYVKLAIVQ